MVDLAHSIPDAQADRDWNAPVVGRALSSRNATFFGRIMLMICICAWITVPIVGYSSALGMLTLVGFAGAILGIANPALGLISIAFLCTMDPIQRNLLMGGGLLRYNTLNYFLLTVIFFACPMLLRMKDIHTRLMQALLLLLLMGLTYTPNFRLGQIHILNVVTMFGLVVYVRRARTEPLAWTWAGIVCGTSAAISVPLFYVYYPHYLDKNALAYVPLGAAFVLSIAHLIEPKSTKLMFVVESLCVINLGWVAISGCRGATLPGILCLLCLLVGVRRFHHAIASVAIIIPLIIAVSMVFPEQRDNAVHRFVKMLDSDRSMVSRTSGRSDLMVGAWHIFLDHPLGVGTGGFGDYYSVYSETQSGIQYARGRARPAHSGWTKVLSENGIPGILLFGGYVFSFALFGIIAQDKRYFVIGFLCTGSLAVAFLTGEFQSKAVWLLAASTTVILSNRRPARPLEAESSVPIQSQRLKPAQRAVSARADRNLS